MIRKNINMKIAVPVMVVILIVLVILKATGLLALNNTVTLGFSGNTTLHKAHGKYSKMQGRFNFVLRPSDDQSVLHCEIKTNSGSIRVAVTEQSNDEKLFEKEISGNESFDVNADGKVKITLETESHSGSYSFKY